MFWPLSTAARASSRISTIGRAPPPPGCPAGLSTRRPEKSATMLPAPSCLGPGASFLSGSVRLEPETFLQPAADPLLGPGRHVGCRIHRLVDAVHAGLVLAELFFHESDGLGIARHLLCRVAIGHHDVLRRVFRHDQE